MRIALFVALFPLIWAAINYVTWRQTAASVKRMSPRAQRPWNWRVLAGPFAYYPWLNRTHPDDDNPTPLEHS